MDRRRAAAYSRIRYSLSLADTAYTLLLAAAFARSGWSNSLAGWLLDITKNPFLALAAFVCAVYGLHYFLSFPLNFYQSFLLEHRFSLSKQRFGAWFKDQLKAGLIAYALSMILLPVFYWAAGSFPRAWWLVISLFWILVNLVLARLAPVVILPLFFKYRKISDEGLRGRILGLAQKMQLKVADVFEIDMSRKTIKANAGLMGWGASRRVVLGDTLRDKYTPEEIEVILAHEFSHQKLGHIAKLIALNSLASIGCFYLIYATHPLFLSLYRLSSLEDIAGLPLLVTYVILFGMITRPLFNYLSRRMERDADLMALRTTGLKDSFISTMEKLGSQNLSDREPHPVIKFFFFDHPPINERIAMARRQ